jgi:hypothetical protein
MAMALEQGSCFEAYPHALAIIALPRERRHDVFFFARPLGQCIGSGAIILKHSKDIHRERSRNLPTQTA